MNIVVASDGTESNISVSTKISFHLNTNLCITIIIAWLVLVTLCVTAALPRPLIIADVNIIARVTPLALNKADNLVIMCEQYHI